MVSDTTTQTFEIQPKVFVDSEFARPIDARYTLEVDDSDVIDFKGHKHFEVGSYNAVAKSQLIELFDGQNTINVNNAADAHANGDNLSDQEKIQNGLTSFAN